MKSQIWHPAAGCVPLLGEGSEKEQWPLPALLSRRKTPLNSFPDDGQFSSSPYVSDSFQSAAHVLELRGSESK